MLKAVKSLGLGVLGTIFFISLSCDRIFKEDITPFELTTKEEEFKPDSANPVVVGKIVIDSLDISKNHVRTHEAVIGDIITDAIKWYLKDKDNVDIDVVFENAGAIRTNTVYYPDRGDTLYLTDWMLYKMFPFHEVAVKLTLTGDELKSVLERGASALPQPAGRFLQVSSGFAFSIDTTKSPQLLNIDESSIEKEGERIIEMKLKGENVVPSDTYTVVMSRFIVYSGGDSYLAVINLPGSRKEDLGRYYYNALLAYLEHIDAVNNPILADTLSRRINIVP